MQEMFKVLTEIIGFLNFFSSCHMACRSVCSYCWWFQY